MIRPAPEVGEIWEFPPNRFRIIEIDDGHVRMLDLANGMPPKRDPYPLSGFLNENWSRVFKRQSVCAACDGSFDADEHDVHYLCEACR